MAVSKSFPKYRRARDCRLLLGPLFHLACRRQTERLCVFECPSRHVLAISRGLGDTGHITQGASGKAILAFLDRAERNAIIEAAPPCVDTTRLAKELDATQRKGFFGDQSSGEDGCDVKRGPGSLASKAAASATWNSERSTARTSAVCALSKRIANSPNMDPGSEILAICVPSLTTSTTPCLRSSSFPVVAPAAITVSPGSYLATGSIARLF